VSNEAKLLIKKMLNLNPELRISAEEALGDPWIKEYSQKGASMTREEILKQPLMLEVLDNVKKLDIS